MNISILNTNTWDGIIKFGCHHASKFGIIFSNGGHVNMIIINMKIWLNLNKWSHMMPPASEFEQINCIKWPCWVIASIWLYFNLYFKKLKFFLLVDKKTHFIIFKIKTGPYGNQFPNCSMNLIVQFESSRKGLFLTSFLKSGNLLLEGNFKFFNMFNIKIGQYSSYAQF